MLLDLADDTVAIDVAGDDHRHQVGTIPVTVEAQQRFTRRLLDDLGFADRPTVDVARSLELRAQDLVARPLAGAEVHPPLGEDDGALPIDGVLIEGGGVRPVLEHEQRAIERTGNVGRDAKRVLRLVVTRGGVGVSADAQPERRQESGELLLREVLGALELHVLDEMRQTQLVVVFEHRAGLDDQSKLSAPRRLGVRPDVVAQPVRQRANGDLRVDRHQLRQRIGGNRGRGCFAAGGGLREYGGTEKDGEKGETGDAAARKGHTLILRRAPGAPASGRLFLHLFSPSWCAPSRLFLWGCGL